MFVRTIIFGIINFGALALGSYLMGQGATSDWYDRLNRAPWTPPGWAFGTAWTTIMVCFSVYMAELWRQTDNLTLVLMLFLLQWLLNVSWNPTFFKYHEVLSALVIILSLTGIVIVFFFHHLSLLKLKSIWILPYLCWLIIASSLNAYIYLKN